MNLRRLTSLLALSTPLALQTGCGKCEGVDFWQCAKPGMASDSDSESTEGTASTTTTDPTAPTTTTMTSEMSTTETMGTTETMPPCNMNGVCDEGESPQSCEGDCQNCGNGVLDEGEDCDDGENNSPDNAWHDGDAATAPCNSSCTGKVPFCGDDMCDSPDENLMTCPDDGCMAVCGNGAIEPGEMCDDGNSVDTDECPNTCQPAFCGDGIVRDGVETCDDANMIDTDACVMCNAAVCGDGFTWSDMEACDDANADETDECDARCNIVVHRKVFVSSVGSKGNLGGLSGADIRCQTLADAANVPGNFQAWLSDANIGPASPGRFDTEFTGVYELVDGTFVAHGWDDLTDGDLAHAIDLTEVQGAPPLDVVVWSNTTPSGEPIGTFHCKDWTSVSATVTGQYGIASGSDATWTQAGLPEIQPCSGTASIYCFEDPA